MFPKFLMLMCSHTRTHTHRGDKNIVTELGYREDIKIDKNIRFLLRQEMKEMDCAVFHTSVSLSIPLRRVLLPPSHADCFGKREDLPV